MAPEHILNIEWRGVESLGDIHNLGRRDEQEDGRRIDEAADQPWAGDAVDLRPVPRHPNGTATPVAFWNFVGGDGWPVGRLPGDMAAIENFGSDIAMTKPSGRAFAEFLSLLADDDDGPAVEASCPILNVKVRAADGAWDQARVGRKVLVDSNVN